VRVHDVPGAFTNVVPREIMANLNVRRAGPAVSVDAGIFEASSLHQHGIAAHAERERHSPDALAARPINKIQPDYVPSSATAIAETVGEPANPARPGAV
jgi:hypothetical protein